MIYLAHSAILTERVARHTRVLTNSTNLFTNRLVAALAVILVAVLYLTGLNRMGLLSTDEPRYAAVGQAMAESGDWITPRLWGQPWFEKPALLYWMTATGFKLGLGPDLAPRLPVALISVAFLILFRLRLIRVFDEPAANYATAILATTAGWLGYSHVAVPDAPLAIFFTMAVLFSLRPNGAAEPNRVAAAILLGLAVLAKSVPPLMLFLPVLFLDRVNWRRWFVSWPIVAFIAVALPWHLIAIIRNGWNFAYVLFIEQQFGRFFNNSRLHGQPWWFYGPVFLLLLFPWFPLLGLACRHVNDDKRSRTLAAVVAVGLIFFSASINKLTGYVLPLVPATCVLMGVALTRAARKERWLIASIALLGTLPLAASILPEAMVHGLRTTRIPWASGLPSLAAAAAGVGTMYWLRSRAFQVAILLAAAGFIWAEIDLFPSLDRTASARTLWSANHPDCAPLLARNMLYGLYYYAGKRLPDCAIVDKNANQSSGTGQAQ
jgi:4-amino-4-deoxy-L-arabinose transferase-like glycosyltransferase